MFSGSRLCLNNKIQKATVPIPEACYSQPLLFLYPRWFATASPKFQRAKFDPAQKVRNTSCDEERSASTEYNGEKERESQHASGFSRTNGSPRSHSSTLAPADQLSRPESTRESSPSQDLSVRKIKPRDPDIPVYGVLGKRETQIRKALEKAEEITSTKSPTSASGQRAVIRSNVPSVFHHPHQFNGGTWAHQRSTKRTVMRMKHDPKRLDWEVPMKILMTATDVTNKKMSGDVVLRTGTIYELTGSTGPNAWMHNIRDGCEITVPSKQSDRSDTRPVTLRGSPRAIELTREFLLNAERRLYGTALFVPPSEEESPPVRSVFAERRTSLVNRETCRADELCVPAEWSIRSFAGYIESLVSMQIPRTIRREIYTNGETHTRTVANVLERTFSDPAIEAFISARAVHDALSFMCKHTHLTSTSDFILNKFKLLGLSLPIETYNLLYKSALEQNDLERFKSIFAHMQHSTVTPNGATWCALLDVVKSEDARRRILQYMQDEKKGLSEYAFSTMGAKAQLAIYEIDAYFGSSASKGRFQEFVSFMDQNYQRNWVSRSRVNRMVDACGEKKLWHLTPQILELSQNRNDKLGPRNLTHLLKNLRQRGNLHGSIELLSSHFARTLGREDAYVIPEIFMLAWSKRCCNVCRVLWRYAAVKGIITFKMQDVVTNSLVKNHDTPGLPASHYSWTISAGKIIVGTNPDITELDSRFSLVRQSSTSNPMIWLARWTPNDGKREQQLSLAYLMMYRDLTAWKHFAPMNSQSLLKLLSDACDMDYKWRRDKNDMSLTVDWRIENAIEVPLVRQEIGFQDRHVDSSKRPLVTEHDDAVSKQTTPPTGVDGAGSELTSLGSNLGPEAPTIEHSDDPPADSNKMA